MNVFGAKIVFLVVVVFWILPDFTASNMDMCSCYSFHGNSSSRQEARQHCNDAEGDLVSIETDVELNFIQKQLQNETTKNGDNEWWIGLEKENGKWKWLSNHTDLQIDENLLVSEGEGEAFATIAHNSSYASQFQFNVIINDTVGKGWICEYENKDCNNIRGANVCEHVLVKTTITTTTSNTYSTTNKPATTTRITSTTASTTTPPITGTTKTTSTTKPITSTTTPTTTTTSPTAAAATTKIKTTMTTSTIKSKITATPKTAKLTSAAPTTATTTAATTRRRPPFIGFLTTTASPVHECLPDLYLIIAISVSMVGLATVVSFTGLFLFVVCRKKCLKPQPSVEKIEMEEGEYENHL
ncbi:uncharacterized protein LOC116287813 [Actinia tenebrosa]|uniref:Uncharacterized protein LOC116287813 n=1 Tax=Actinia tenebrosa TaxID=6105 RepID=A0A6P8H4L6_ACTTE|nr:uncharacterized protein LOC116287813 [Actinia tenebrosa]